jgi:predicted RNA-binding Zn-ribbon protein involved in translation (DUF1610 family)
MRVCPSCGTTIVSASSSSASVEIDYGGGKASRRSLDQYSCEKCGSHFAVLRGRGDVELVPTKDISTVFARLKRAESSNEILRKRVSSLGAEKRSLAGALKRAKEMSYTRTLQTKVDQLEQQVAYLKKERGRLQERLTGTA